MTSYSLYYFTQGATPTQWAGASAQGPAGAPFQCYPSPTRTITDTFEWIATGNGCPIGYGLSSQQFATSATCIWTGYFSPPQAFTWECLFTVGADVITTVDGGTTTIANGNAATVTANPQTITVTKTAQQTSTGTSIVAPGAATVSVTSTVTQNGALAKRNHLPVAKSEAAQAPVLGVMNLGTDVEYSFSNSSNPLAERACAVPCLNYCCDGRTCIGDGYHCCSTYSCVNYDPSVIFLEYGASYLRFISVIDTTTTTNYKTKTTYETVSIASGTITVTPTSTLDVTITNIQTVYVTVTTQAATITVTVLTTMILSSPPQTSPSTGPVGSITTPGPVIGSVSFVTTTGTLTHSAIPSWPGSGPLLVGYCTSADYVLLTGPTAYWAPFVGCDQNKPDCCPFAVNAGAANYPTAKAASQATLANCPADYQTVSNGCCPIGYALWNTQLGGQVPCFSTLNSYTTPPPIPSTLLALVGLSASQTPISAIENIVYAIQYPVNPPSSGLSVGAQAGIGAGAGVVGLAALALGIFFLLRRRRGRSQQEPKSDAHYSGSTFMSAGLESPTHNIQQTPTIPYIATQHQGLEHYPDAHSYAEKNASVMSAGRYMEPAYPVPAPDPVVPQFGGYPPPHQEPQFEQQPQPQPQPQHTQESAALPVAGYLPQEDPQYTLQPAYQNWPPMQDRHWQTAQGLQVSPPTSTASPPPDPRYGSDGYSSPASQTGLRPSELHASQAADYHAEHTQELHGDQQDRWELGGRP